MINYARVHIEMLVEMQILAKVKNYLNATNRCRQNRTMKALGIASVGAQLASN